VTFKFRYWKLENVIVKADSHGSIETNSAIDFVSFDWMSDCENQTCLSIKLHRMWHLLMTYRYLSRKWTLPRQSSHATLSINGMAMYTASVNAPIKEYIA